MLANESASSEAETGRSVQIKQLRHATLPAVTTGTSEAYLEKTATAMAHAVLPSVPWRLIFGRGKDMSDEERLQAYHAAVKGFLVDKTATGGFVAEAGDFSACALWTPPGCHGLIKSFFVLEEDEESLQAAFDREVGKVKAEYMSSKFGQNFWQLELLARDPRRPSVPGAVRAVLQTYMDQAAAAEQPIWLVTTNEKAKDMYLHLGWQLVRQVTIDTLSEWCMILHPPSTDTAHQ